MIRSFWLRLLSFLHRDRLSAELAEEMRLHTEMRAAQITARTGLDTEEACLAAQKQFGNSTLLQETSRDTWRWPLLEHVLQDLRFALRSLRKDPLFTAVAIATFALGIGANTAIFSLVNAVLLRPLPYPEAGRIAQLSLAWKDGTLNNTVTVPEFEFYRDHNSAFEAIAGYRAGATVAIQHRDAPEYLKAARLTDGFFRVLGVPPAAGRAIERPETRPGSAPVAVLSDSLWRQAYHADPSLIGRQIVVDDASYTVVGIMPSSFTFVEQPIDVYLPLQLGRGTSDTGMNTHVIARLKPGVTLAQAQSNIDVVFDQFRRQGAAQSGQRGVQLLNYQKWLAGDFRASILLLFAAVCLLLLIACANVAGLLLARATARQREIAVRCALGAGRARLLQQFLAESLLIALAGAAAGLLTARWGLQALLATVPWNIPLADQVKLDPFVLSFALALTLLTSLVFGLCSYTQLACLDLHTSLKEAGNQQSRGASRNPARSILVVAEIALSLMLSIAAGLLIESLYRLHQQHLGFDPDRVFTAVTPFDRTRAYTAPQIWTFEQAVLARLQAVPGVTSAAVTSNLPLSGPDNLPTQQAGHPEHSIGGMEYRAVSAGYFETMRIPLRQGRAFRSSDTASSLPVAIVSETVARAWWNEASPLGDRIIVGQYAGKTYPDVLEPPRQVIGVVADVKNLRIDETDPTTVYVPAPQLAHAPDAVSWAVRSSGNLPLAAPLRATIAAVNPAQRILQLQPMSNIVARSTARPTFNASLMATFAALALALSAIGLYGLLSFQVARRTSEIGIRMALGASRSSVLSLVIRQAALLAALGIAFGLAGAAALARVLSSLFAGIHPTSPLIYLLVPALLLGVALFASYLPARRASRVDPLVALRHD